MVSYRDGDGVEHSVEVTASSKYEAAAIALKAFRAAAFWEECQPSKLAKLRVQVKAQVEITHEFRLEQFQDWLARDGRFPREIVLKDRLRELLD